MRALFSNDRNEYAQTLSGGVRYIARSGLLGINGMECGAGLEYEFQRRQRCKQKVFSANNNVGNTAGDVLHQPERGIFYTAADDACAAPFQQTEHQTQTLESAAGCRAGCSGHFSALAAGSAVESAENVFTV